MNWVSYLPFPFYITNHKTIKFLETFWNLDKTFAIEMCHLCCGIDLLQSSFSINLNSFYVKIGNLLQRHQNSTVSRPLSSLNCFSWNSFEFVVLMLKSSFDFLEVTMKSQKWSKSEVLGSNYMFKGRLAEYYKVCPNKCILKSFKFLASSLDIHFAWTQCMLVITC